MTKIICCPEHLLPSSLASDTLYSTLFSKSTREGVGHVGLALPDAISKSKLVPSVATWDFATFALAVDAADKMILRNKSADGWTRMIDLTVYIINPVPWQTQANNIEFTLRFLTGDFWKLSFKASGIEVPRARKPQIRDADCLCLLSGGMDSLAGAIDLTAKGRMPIFISHIVRGSKISQKKFAEVVGASERHFQWSSAVEYTETLEKSTRARSIVFLAFAALGASGISTNDDCKVEVVVPENGFISLNIPLAPNRIGSLSTKTTHPIYLSGIESIWNALGINLCFSFPFRYKTKGELINDCANQPQLTDLIYESVSCSKYHRHNLTHCGECVPCMIRRAAFLAADIEDKTEGGYICSDLSNATSSDVRAAAMACIYFRKQGLRRFIGGSLNFSPIDQREMYEGVITRGMEELENLLNEHGVL